MICKNVRNENLKRVYFLIFSYQSKIQRDNYTRRIQKQVAMLQHAGDDTVSDGIWFETPPNLSLLNTTVYDLD